MFLHTKPARTIMAILAIASLAACSEKGSNSANDLSSQAPKGLPQASLSLKDSNALLSQENQVPWDLSKSGVLTDGSVSWSVTAIKGTASAKTLFLDGFLRITNGGSGPASIGSILVNLQRKSGSKWVSASVDIANATAGDAATMAKICSPASSENLSSFSTNTASGKVEFLDASSNTLFSLSPQKSIGANATVDLLFKATFNNSILNIPDNEELRFEVIVTFGNAGDRGGSGATCANVDADGNGSIGVDENNVRSVPTRITLKAPALVTHNDSVTLADLLSDLSSTGTVTFADFSTDIGGGSGTELIFASSNRGVFNSVAAGTSGGSVTNCAHLTSPDSTVTLNGPIDTTTLQPTYTYTFVNQVGLSLNACDTVEIPAPPTEEPPPPVVVLKDGDYCSYTQGGWGADPNGNNPAMKLQNGFAGVYGAAGVKIGDSTKYTATFTSSAAINAFLPQGGMAGIFTSSTSNPTSTSAKVFGGQVLSLQLTVNFNDAGVLTTPLALKFGDLYIEGTGDASIDGKKVREVLALANQVIGGVSVSDYSAGTLNSIVDLLNKSFDNCVISSWASEHLSLTKPAVSGSEFN